MSQFKHNANRQQYKTIQCHAVSQQGNHDIVAITSTTTTIIIMSPRSSVRPSLLLSPAVSQRRRRKFLLCSAIAIHTHPTVYTHIHTHTQKKKKKKKKNKEKQHNKKALKQWMDIPDARKGENFCCQPSSTLYSHFMMPPAKTVTDGTWGHCSFPQNPAGALFPVPEQLPTTRPGADGNLQHELT